MSTQSIFSAVLGLSSNWRIVDVTLSEREDKLNISVRVKAGVVFPCPKCGRSSLQVSETERCWLNENFFNRQAILTAVVPLVLCNECGANRIVAPWERSGSHFRCIESPPVHADTRAAGDADGDQGS